MDFIKKHYEKILLCVVLLGLVAALLFMAWVIPSEQQKVKDITSSIIGSHVSALTNLDLTRQSNIIMQLQSPYRLDFDTTNKLFNPVEWQRRPDGTLIKGGKAGPNAAVVTSIRPLYTVLSLDSIETNELGARYAIGVERQAAASPAMQHKTQRFVSTDDRKKDVFTLQQVVGPPENPNYLVLRLADTGQEIQVARDKPFRRVDGYTADIKYDLENAHWSGQRIGNHLHFAGDGDDYTIVDINSDEVVLSAKSNQKKWTLRLAP